MNELWVSTPITKDKLSGLSFYPPILYNFVCTRIILYIVLGTETKELICKLVTSQAHLFSLLLWYVNVCNKRQT